MKAPVIPPESEAHFQAFVIKLARSFGWMVYHTYDSRRSESGFPDLFMLRGSQVVAAELKSHAGRTGPKQHGWLGGMAAAGIDTYIWRPSDKQAIAEILR